jgi:hypothetical protein
MHSQQHSRGSKGDQMSPCENLRKCEVGHIALRETKRKMCTGWGGPAPYELIARNSSN